MDPLSAVLSVLKPRSYSAGGFDLAGDWSIQFGPHDGIKCYALLVGHCWLAVDGVPDALYLQPGDCFLLPRGVTFRLASDLTLTPVDASALFATPLNGRIAKWNGGGDCFGVGGHFTLGGNQARILLEELPPIVHIRSESDKAELRWSLERMRQELREQKPGASLIAQQLATMMLVQALRLHLAERTGNQTGWLSVLSDKQMNGAIVSMQEDPAHQWTLHSLAERSGMSRSVFALKFKASVGTSPMEYLKRWRMLIASDKLTNSNDSVASIALSLGYESQSAFGKAFRRVMGCSPRQFRHGGHPAPARHPEGKSAPTHQFASFAD